MSPDSYRGTMLKKTLKYMCKNKINKKSDTNLTIKKLEDILSEREMNAQLGKRYLYVNIID